MKSYMNFQENNKIEEKEAKEKSNFEDYSSDMLIKKINKNKGSSTQGQFRNNYKKYQYDYEEDFYEPNKY